MKSARDQLDILSAYRELGSYRAAAGAVRDDPQDRPARRRAPRPAAGSSGHPGPRAPIRTATCIAERVRATDGRISAKRLLPLCRAAGYAGSARHLRRAVASREGRLAHGAPGVPALGSRSRASTSSSTGAARATSTSSAPSSPGPGSASSGSRPTRARRRPSPCSPSASRPSAACPAVVLADRMGCLKGGVVANVVVPAPGYVAFAAHYGFRPDFCEAADPECKGVVEHLVGYAKADLLIPGAPFADLAAANAAAVAWCAEVNGRRPLRDRRPSRPSASPTERALLRPLPSLRPAPAPTAVRTVDRLRTVRYGSARYSVPGAFIGPQGRARRRRRRARRPRRRRGDRAPPARRSGRDEPRSMPTMAGPAAAPVRAIRPRTAGRDRVPRPRSGRGGVPAGRGRRRGMRAARGRDRRYRRPRARRTGARRSSAALERALAYRRFRAADLRSILAAGAGRARATGSRVSGSPIEPARGPGPAPRGVCPRARLVSAAVAGSPRPRPRGRPAPAQARPRSGGWRPRSSSPRRSSAGRPTSSCAPCSRPSSARAMPRTRGRGCGPPGSRSARRSTSSGSPSRSIPRATFDYLASLEWIRARENLVLVGPAGTGKSHTLIALGHAAVETGLPGPLLRGGIARRGAVPGPRRQQRRAAHRGPPAGRPRDRRRPRLRAARRHRRPAPVPLRRRGLRAPQPRASRPTGRSSPGAASCPSTPPRSPCSTACSTTPSPSSRRATPTG